MRASGGYVLHKSKLIRSFICDHTAALDRPLSQEALAALNAIQATPWRINVDVLGVLQEAYDGKVDVAELAEALPPELPERMDDEVWEGLSPEDKSAHRSKLARIHSARASAIGKRQSLEQRLADAEELAEHPAIWFPHTLDFRGRIYPLAVSGPHPQGDDVAKALLEFAEGKPLGDTGLYWLAVRAASNYGHDKLPLDERLAWTFDNAEKIAAVQAAPLDPEAAAFWSAAEEPWQFLASCLELGTALFMEDPSIFVSRLPVPMDGTCNGLQHLSAMGLDPVGARAVNLTASEERRDIYEEIAALVREMVEADAAEGDEHALAWLGKVTRKTVKRAVMTTPYGVTDSGIRKQLLSDGQVPVDGDMSGPAADYMRDRLVQALSQTVVAAKSIMAWLQAVAKRLADAGEAFEWTTPHGCRIRQEYTVLSEKRIVTLAGRLVMADPVPTGMLNARKQALGSAPNFIHSFDAAHLSLTVNAAVAEGITAFSMIHDSYGTHACDTNKLARLLRETFVAIYQHDWLGDLRAELTARYPHVEFPPVPPKGTFSVEEVLASPFFFS